MSCWGGVRRGSGWKKEDGFFSYPSLVPKIWGGSQRLRSCTVLCTVKEEEEEGPPRIGIELGKMWETSGCLRLNLTIWVPFTVVVGNATQSETFIPEKPTDKKSYFLPFFPMWNSLAFPIKNFCHAPLFPYAEIFLHVPYYCYSHSGMRRRRFNQEISSPSIRNSQSGKRRWVGRWQFRKGLTDRWSGEGKEGEVGQIFANPPPPLPPPTYLLLLLQGMNKSSSSFHFPHFRSQKINCVPSKKRGRFFSPPPRLLTPFISDGGGGGVSQRREGRGDPFWGGRKGLWGRASNKKEEKEAEKKTCQQCRRRRSL